MPLSDDAPAAAASPPTPCTVRIALGSNLGERAEQLRRARVRLEKEGWVTQQRRSDVLETAPVGPPQPHYLNQVIVGVTTLSAAELLQRVKGLEVELGRVPGPRWGARCIDIDLLDLGGQAVDIPGLRLPHPEIARRSFVLEPWSQVEPHYRLPGESRTIAELWRDAFGEARVDRGVDRGADAPVTNPPVAAAGAEDVASPAELNPGEIG